MLPLVIPIKLEPSRQEGDVGKDEVDVDLVSAPDEEMHGRFGVNGVQVFPHIVEAEELHSLLRYGLVESLYTKVSSTVGIQCSISAYIAGETAKVRYTSACYLNTRA